MFRITIFLGVFVCSSAMAATHYVDLNSATPVPPYTGWATAATNIQDAVGVATNGETVLVADGYYAISSSIVISDNITLASVNGPTETIIDGTGSRAYIDANSVCTISGFTVENFVGNYVIAGVNTTIRPTVTNCIIEGNWAIGIWYGDVYDCIIRNNVGSGLYFCTAYDCEIRRNVSSSSGGGAYVSILYNCLIIDNSAGSGGGINQCTAYNCTFIDNTAASSGDTSESATIYNSVIDYRNRVPTSNYYSLYGNMGVFGAQNTSSLPVLFSCSPYLPDGLYGNLQADPLFENAANGNYRLSALSPCINAGVNVISHTATDYDGNPRIVAGSIDLGAFEFQSGDPVIDADGDGLAELVELQNGTDPNNIDTDGDGIDDGMELAHGLNPLVADSWIVPYMSSIAEAFGISLGGTGGVVDVAVDQMLLETTNGEARLSLQLEKSGDLVTWTNASDAVEWVMPVDADVQFFRVRSGP